MKNGVKKLSALYFKITSKHGGDFYCLNCLHSFSTKNKLKEHENVCTNHDYCYIKMPKEEYQNITYQNIIYQNIATYSTSKYNQAEKSIKVPFFICADMESLLEKIDTGHNIPEKSSTTKINKHTASSYSLFTHYSFDVTKNKHDYYRDKDCMNNFWKDLNRRIASWGRGGERGRTTPLPDFKKLNLP